MAPRAVAAVKVVVFLAALFPAARLVYGIFLDSDLLGVNPAEFITRALGDWALRLLLAAPWR